MNVPPLSRKRSSSSNAASRSILLPIKSVPMHTVLTSTLEGPNLTVFIGKAPMILPILLAVRREDNPPDHYQHPGEFRERDGLHRRTQPSKMRHDEAADYLAGEQRDHDGPGAGLG